MTAIDDYLSRVEPVRREPLERIRTLAKLRVPGAEEAIVYAMPTLRFRGKPFLGFAARRDFIGLYPYSAEVIERLQEVLHGFRCTKGAIHVPLGEPIAEAILNQLIDARIEQIDRSLPTG